MVTPSFDSDSMRPQSVTAAPLRHQPRLRRRHVVEPIAAVEIDSSVGWGRDVDIDTTGGISIGAQTVITHRVLILTHEHRGLTAAPDLDQPFGELQPRPLQIGAHVFIGESAVILPQCGSIGDWAVIGAFSVVTKPVGPGEIWAGNPARFLKMRAGMIRQSPDTLKTPGA